MIQKLSEPIACYIISSRRKKENLVFSRFKAFEDFGETRRQSSISQCIVLRAIDHILQGVSRLCVVFVKDIT